MQPSSTPPGRSARLPELRAAEVTREITSRSRRRRPSPGAGCGADPGWCGRRTRRTPGTRTGWATAEPKPKKYLRSTVGAIIFENHIINHDFLSVFKWGLPTSTSIFSAISASIFKISVPIIKRRSSGFRNTPRSHLSDEYWPRKQQKTKWQPKLNIKNILGKIYLL